MIAVTLITLILGISQFAIHLLIFAGAFTLSLKLLGAASRSKSLFLGVIGSSLLYLFSVGPVLLSCRFLANGFSQPNVFEPVTRFFEVFYIPVYEMAEGYAEAPILWYTNSWLLDRSWTANVTDSAYLMFLVLIPWLLDSLCWDSFCHSKADSVRSWRAELPTLRLPFLQSPLLRRSGNLRPKLTGQPQFKPPTTQLNAQCSKQSREVVSPLFAPGYVNRREPCRANRGESQFKRQLGNAAWKSANPCSVTPVSSTFSCSSSVHLVNRSNISSLFSRRATSIARHSRVCSSISVSMRNTRPSLVRSMPARYWATVAEASSPNVE